MYVPFTLLIMYCTFIRICNEGEAVDGQVLNKVCYITDRHFVLKKRPVMIYRAKNAG